MHMSMVRPALALDPRRFGQRFVLHAQKAEISGSLLSDDLRLFATTFAAGFVFMSVLIF